MKTTVAQLIAKLQEFPLDAEVECGKEVRGSYDCWMEFAPVDLEDFGVYDYTSEADRVKFPAMAGKVLIVLRAI